MFMSWHSIVDTHNGITQVGVPSDPDPQALSWLSSVPGNGYTHSLCLLKNRATAPLKHPGLSILSVQTRSSFAKFQSQPEAPGTAHSPRRAPPPSGACSGLWPCWVRGYFSPGCWGPSLAAAEHRGTASPHPGPLLQELLSLLAAHHAWWLHRLPPAPTGLTLPRQGSAATKDQNPFLTRSSSEFILSTAQTTNQPKILPPPPLYRWEKQAARVRDALTFRLVFAIQWFSPPPSQLP